MVIDLPYFYFGPDYICRVVQVATPGATSDGFDHPEVTFVEQLNVPIEGAVGKHLNTLRAESEANWKAKLPTGRPGFSTWQPVNYPEGTGDIR